ncbi:MAG: aldehyde dehydrogenase family protein [Polyangiaceae bacterium]|nr:aldehyde dehydrogenase family protein [Polyangiaceae bacterium]
MSTETSTRPQNGHSQAVRTQEIRNVSPVDLRPLSPVPMTPVASIGAVVQRSRNAQPGWAELSIDERAAALTRAAKRMLRERDDVIALVREEVGKSDAEGVFNEALGPLDAVNGWTKIVKEHVGPRPVGLNPMSFPKKRASITLVPRGVVGIIAPWNFPVSGLYRSVIPTLLTGNGLILKPSEYAPRSSAWFVEQIARELPAGLASIVQGDGSVGSALIDAGIDACVFTGSVKTGKSVRVKCAERGIVSSVEMGGKDAAIVLADADLDRAAAGITQWALNNAGQACGAIEVVYADRHIADELSQKLGRAWRKLKTGSGDVDVAPLANERQLAIVEAHVKDAIAKGATLVCGGARGEKGLTYLPTVLDHCTAEMDVVKDETFGPVVAIVRVDGASDATRHVNASRYGLGASIWSRDTQRAARLAEKLDVGVVTVNNHAFTGAIPSLPWTGTRDTGFGVANSEYALSTFTRPKTIVVDNADGPDFFWLPYDKTLTEIGHLLADAQVGKILGAWKLPFLMRDRVGRIKEFFNR